MTPVTVVLVHTPILGSVHYDVLEVPTGRGGEFSREVPMSEAYQAAPEQPAGETHDGSDRIKAAVFAGLIAAVVGGIVWAVIVVVTGYEVGWVAWAVGGLVGITMAAVTPVRSRSLGMRAAVLAAVGLLVGKWLIVEIGARTTFTDEVVADSELLSQAVFINMIDKDEVPAHLLAAIEDLGEEEYLPDSLMLQIQASVAQRIATMDEAEKQAVAEQFVQMAVGDLGFIGRMRSTMSGWDLLWFFLAVGTAWKLTTPATREEEGAVTVKDEVPPSS